MTKTYGLQMRTAALPADKASVAPAAGKAKSVAYLIGGRPAHGQRVVVIVNEFVAARIQILNELS